MNFLEIDYQEALRNSFRSQEIVQYSYNSYIDGIQKLADISIQDTTEEAYKKSIISFLEDTFYKPHFPVSMKGDIDLVIFNSDTQFKTVGVIFEVKTPKNTNEMISKQKMNVKALHQLVFYFLQERFIAENHRIQHLVATNLTDWYIFRASDFENIFNDKKLVETFRAIKTKQTLNHTTDYFYNEVAKTFIENSKDTLPYCYFNIKQLNAFAAEKDRQSSKEKLELVYKILSPTHLLRLPIQNDSNKLNEVFYNELLHVMGLEEVLDNGRILIQRKKPKDRDSGSFVEKIIFHIEERADKSKLSEEYQSKDVFELALELAIAWINRILFLKLLEAQLYEFNYNNKEYKFLNKDFIPNYDELETLFFSILAKKIDERHPNFTEKYANIPYLNSTLFEKTTLEKDLLNISNLDSNQVLNIMSGTALRDSNGNRKKGKLPTLVYLFEFLDSFIFTSSETTINNDNPDSLINAAVLGLIFEKINGYKDGSFFTPGFITMYMAKESIRRTVVNKFNKKFNLNFEKFDDVKDWSIYNSFQSNDKNEYRKQANEIINSIKICDPAVGSGHFLVSALNELIAIKSELGIITDSEGKYLGSVVLKVVNDTLQMEIGDGAVYKYLKNTTKLDLILENQRIQETIFREKQTIIENCLFGVDINFNSVQICRLRLWIELLKNAFYTKESGYKQLETLPNIDINIKQGNSLLKKYSLRDSALRVGDRKYIEIYKQAVAEYKRTDNREKKAQIKSVINDVQAKFKGFWQGKDKVEKAIDEKYEKINEINSQINFGEKNEKNEKLKLKLEKEINALVETKRRKDEILKDAKYMEWRFEFPEVLDSNGDFIGFDIVLGNPPYIQLQKDGGKLADIFADQDYKTYSRMGDIYTLFIELAFEIISNDSYLSLITSNKWMRAGYGQPTREFLSKNYDTVLLVDTSGTKVFDSATVDTNIILAQKKPNSGKAMAGGLSRKYKKEDDDFEELANQNLIATTAFNTSDAWIISTKIEQQIRKKIEKIGTPLKDWDINIYRGVLTGYNEAFIIDGKKKDEIIAQDPKSAEIIKPILRGRDIKRYKAEFADLWIIFIPKGYTIKSMQKAEKLEKETQEDKFSGIVEEPMPRYGYFEPDPALNFMNNRFPAIMNHLKNYKWKAMERLDQGDYWWELRACAYLDEFEKEKIVWNRIASIKVFSLVKESYYIQDSMHFITGKKLDVICGILNSKLIAWLMNLIVGKAAGGNAGNADNIKNLPIPKISETEQEPFIRLVEDILAKKEADPNADTTAQESEIDHLVYQLYNLTPEEIAVVEGKE